MKFLIVLGCTTAAFLIAGCASFESIKPGASMAEVERQFHAPGARRIEAGGNQVWDYDLGPLGRAFWQLRFGPDGRLLTATQTLTEDNFRNIRFGQATRDDLAREFGKPYRKYLFVNLADEVWDYRYQRNTWAMLASMHIDPATGAVKSCFTQPDPEVYAAYGRGRRR